MNHFTAFSGGKDSTALALLCEESTPVFTDTGWEFPEIYEHISKFEAITGRQVVRIKAELTLPEYIRKYKYFPGHSSRFCTRVSKIDPMNEFVKQHLPAEIYVGLRFDENRVGNETNIDGLEYQYPLQEEGLILEDIVAICRDHDLLPNYPPYMRRGGCVGCFYKTPSEIRALVHMLPGVADELQALEEEIQDVRTRYAFMFPSLKMSIRNLREQPELFDPKQFYEEYEDNHRTPPCGMFCHK